MSDARLIALDRTTQGSRAIVRTLTGGIGLVSRLAAMGIVSGAPILVLQNRGRGPMLVLVRDTRVALGRGEARRIVVEEPRDRSHGDDGRHAR
jgi:ferrous iron transport protein A